MSLKLKVPGLAAAAAAAQCSVAMGVTAAGKLESCVPPPLLLLGSLWLLAQLPQNKDQDYRHYLCSSPISASSMCFSIHRSLDVQILWHLGVLGRDTFVELWMFYLS